MAEKRIFDNALNILALNPGILIVPICNPLKKALKGQTDRNKQETFKLRIIRVSKRLPDGVNGRDRAANARAELKTSTLSELRF